MDSGLVIGRSRAVFRSTLRRVSNCALLFLTPLALAQTTGVAVLYGTGSVYLNGSQLTNSNAVMTGDVIQTKDDGAAHITAPGSSIAVESNSIVRYHADGVSLDRGGVSVATSQGTSVYARDFKITPTSNAWTEYYVTRSSGSIGIIARKNAVAVTCGSNAATVKEGQQLSRADAADCGLAGKVSGAPAAARVPILASSTAQWGALAAGGGIAAWSLSHGDDPISPDGP